MRPQVARAAVGASVATAVSRVFGFVRVLVVVAVLGTTYLGNTFQSSNLVSNVLFELVAAGALSAVLVPSIVRLRDNPEELSKLIGGLMVVAVLSLAVLSIIGVVVAPWIADLLVANVQDPTIAELQQSLSTFLLRFFIPQVVFYAVGTISIAVLHAHRRFVLAAAAPIANTAVMVGFLGWFYYATDQNTTGIGLSLQEKLLLAGAGTIGVLAYVAIPTIGARAIGLRARLRWPKYGSEVWVLLRHAGWASLIHAVAGILLGVALVIGNGIAGGSVAYNAAFVFFLAPWAILAQPIQNAMLPEMSEAGTDSEALRNHVRDGARALALFIAPASGIICALSLPAMRVVTFGSNDTSAEFIAAGLAGMAIGLLPYSVFLLFSRAFFALNDARTPALVSFFAAIWGAVGMIAFGTRYEGAARVAALGLAHSLTYLIAAAVLWALLQARVGSLWSTTVSRAIGAATIAGASVWLLSGLWSTDSRATAFIQSATLSIAAVGLYVLLLHLLRESLPWKLIRETS